MAQRWFGLMGGVAGLAIALGAASTASATTYYLKNVLFDDGTTATGSFSTTVYGYGASWDITTQTGSIAGYDYTPTINATVGPGVATYVFNQLAYAGELQLTTVSPVENGLPDALVTGAGGPSFECFGSCRYIVSGSIVASVPEAASWMLMLTGFGAAGFALRRARRTVTA